MPVGHIKGIWLTLGANAIKRTNKVAHAIKRTNKAMSAIKRTNKRVASKGVPNHISWFREARKSVTNVHGSVNLEIIALRFQYMVWGALACHSKPFTVLFVRFITFVALFVRFIAFMALFVSSIACAALFVRFIALAPSVNHIPFICPTGIFSYMFVRFISRSVSILF